jgi:putative methyltransferase (TIGR04325 family)
MNPAPSLAIVGWRALPVVRQAMEWRKLRYFRSRQGYGAHWGRFGSFAEARSWLPPSPEFELDEHADHYEEERTRRVYAFDYPVIFWLRHALESGARSIYDIGGSVGVHYYSYAKYLPHMEQIDWLVSDLPRVAERGRGLARQRNAKGLTFVDRLDATPVDRDIWMAAGVLEFLESQPFAGLIEAAAKRPKHILLNKLPLHDGPEFVSTQNIGQGCFVPHHVYNRQQFVQRVEDLGYELVDSWETPERSFLVPGRPDLSFDAYSGLYFRRR